MLKVLATTAAFAIAGAGVASAATLSFSATPTTDVANPMATSFTGDIAENTTGTISGVRVSPWDGTSNPNGVYTSITGRANYEFGSSRSTLSFVWGTPDTYNSVEFYRNGALVDTVLGFGDGGNIQDSLATISNINGGLFDAVTFVSTQQPAFEFANLAAVPLPAGGLMLVSALGGLALSRRRKAA